MPAAPGKAGQWETAPARADNQKDWLPAAAGLRAGVSVGQRKSARNQLRIRGEGVATPTAPMFLCSDRAAGWSEKQVLIRRSTTPVSGSPQRPWQPPTGLGSPPVARGRGDSSDRTCLVFLRAQRPGVQRRRRAPLICAAQGSPEGGAESRLLGWILALMWAPTHPFVGLLHGPLVNCPTTRGHRALSAPSGPLKWWAWARAPTSTPRGRRAVARVTLAGRGHGRGRAKVGLPLLAAKPTANVLGGPWTGRVMPATETRKSVLRRPRSHAVRRIAGTSTKGVDGRRC